MDIVRKTHRNCITEHKIGIGYTNSKDNLVSTCYKNIIDHSNRHTYLSVFGTKKFASFPSESLTYTVINSNLRELSSLSLAKFTNYRRTYNMLHSRVTELRAPPMSSTLERGCCSDNKNIEHIGDVYCPKKTCSEKICAWAQKRLSILSAEAIINGTNARSNTSCAFFPLKIKQICFIDWSFWRVAIFNQIS